ncbi:hypothetical protein QTP88_007711 [Uroleucon formosanum]
MSSMFNDKSLSCAFVGYIVETCFVNSLLRSSTCVNLPILSDPGNPAFMKHLVTVSLFIFFKAAVVHITASRTVTFGFFIFSLSIGEITCFKRLNHTIYAIDLPGT